MSTFDVSDVFHLVMECEAMGNVDSVLTDITETYLNYLHSDKTTSNNFEFIFPHLFPRASIGIRHRISLALYPATPLPEDIQRIILTHLENYLPEYVKNHPQLSDSLITELIARNDITLAQALASRADLSPKHLQKLFGINSRKIYRALSSNPALPSTGSYLSAFLRAASMDIIVAENLSERSDFDAALVSGQFFELSENGRLAILTAFKHRNAPNSPTAINLMRASVVTAELTNALMRLFAENKRPKITQLLHQITGINAQYCAEIAHDTTGAALFVVLRAFGCSSYDGLKVLIHACTHETDRSRLLGHYARLFSEVDPQSMSFILSVWRGETDVLQLLEPQFDRRFVQRGNSVAYGISQTPSPESEVLVEKETRRSA